MLLTTSALCTFSSTLCIKLLHRSFTCWESVPKFYHHHITFRGTRWRSWLRHCATSRKVAGSIPDGVIKIFLWRKLSGCTVALGLTHPLTAMSTRYISGGKGGRYVGLTTLPPSMPIVLKSGSLNLWNPQGLSRPVMGLVYLYITFSPSERPGIKYTWMPSPFYPDVISLILIKWYPVVFANVLKWKPCAPD